MAKSLGERTNAGKAASGVRALASALGVSVATAHGYLQRPDWPIARAGPWSAADLRRAAGWRASLQEDRASQGGTALGEQIKTQLTYQRLRRERVRADEAEGQVMPRELLDQALAEYARTIRSIVEDLRDSLPGALYSHAAIAPAASEPVIRRAVSDALRRMASIETMTIDAARDRGAAVASGRRGARGRKRA